MLAVIGGTGFSALMENAKERTLKTEYGNPSSPITVGLLEGKEVAVLHRHGLDHEYPPHRIPYKANISALKQLGVDRIISINSVGSLKPELKPGEILVPDQLISFTRREDTFYNGPETIHVPFSDPYCPEMRKIMITSAKKAASVHEKGTAVVVEGPRFETRAEIDFFSRNGWSVVNMTQYPEAALAREMEICYANASVVTNYCAGIQLNPGIAPLKSEDLPIAMKEYEEKIRKMILESIKAIPENRNCECSKALKGARL